MNKPTRKQWIYIVAMLAVGVLVGGLILGMERAGQPDDDDKPVNRAPGSAAAVATPPAAVSSAVGKPAGTDQSGSDGIVLLTDAQIRQAGITIATSGVDTIRTLTTLSGEIRANGDKTAIVVPRTAGIVETISGTLGQHVRRGDIVATIASAAISDLRSELNVTQHRFVLAKTTYERERVLWKERISAEQDFLQAEQALSEASAAKENVQQKLAALGAASTGGIALNRYEVRAPFDGMLTEKHVVVGNAVKEDTPLFQISDLSTVWADVNVPADNLRSIRVGDNVTVRARQLGTSARGKVSYVSALVGDQSRSAVARVVLPNPNAQWRPGLFAEFDVAEGEIKVPVTVLADAVQDVGGKPTIFVRSKEGFRARPVTVGRTDGQHNEIVSGLKAGEQYAANSFILKAELGKSRAKDND